MPRHSRFRRCVSVPIALALLCLFPLTTQTQNFTAITVRAAREGNSLVNLGDGRDLLTAYVGAAEGRQTLEQNRAEPLSLASADFDEDGRPDLAIGYRGLDHGILSLHRGNVDSIYPNSPEARQRKSEGVFSDSPFLSPARVFDLPEAPDFIGAGDFNADGHWDIVAAARGSSKLYWLPGNGRGDFGPANPIELPGMVTAMVTGEINRADGLTDVVLGITGPGGPQVLVFESPAGALQGQPEVIRLPAAASALALGQLDDSYEMDLAVAAGRDLWIMHGRDRKLSLGESRQAEVPPADIEQRSLSFSIESIALGDFVWDEVHQTDIALLGDDGTVQLLANPNDSGVSTRSFQSRTTTKRLDEWQSESLAGSWPRAAHLVRAVSSGPTDDLVLIDRTNRQLNIISRWSTVSGQRSARQMAATVQGPRTNDIRVASFDVSTEPVAVLPMRLNADALSDLVVLRSGRSSPALVVTVPAATFTVTTTNDSGAGSLREAIYNANAFLVIDTIEFSVSGVITLLSALPALDSNIAINGPGAANLTVSGNHARRVFEVNAGKAVSISGLTIADGNETGIVRPLGGGIFNWGTLMISNCTLSGNSAHRGGGIFAFGGSTLTITNSIVSGNMATSDDGAGIWNGGTLVVDNSSFSGNSAGQTGGGIWNNATLTVNNSTFSGNTAGNSLGHLGGGIFNGAGMATVTNSTLSGNTAFNGGGIHVGFEAGMSSATSTLTVIHSTLSGNMATNGGGIFNPFPDIATMTISNSTLSGNSASSIAGGIFVGLSRLMVNNSTLSSNTAGLDGGGIFNSNGGQVTVSNSTLSGNEAARDGGGIINLFLLQVNNSTLSGNRAGRNGGGILFGVPEQSTLRNVTITDNHADNDNDGSGTGGGIFNIVGRVTLQNTIVAGNGKGAGPTRDDVWGFLESTRLFGGVPVVATSFNLIGDGTGITGFVSNGSNGNQVGSGVSPIDSRLGPLQNNGGPTLTHALLPGSPAIDAGNNALAADPQPPFAGDPLTTDQRGTGFLRIFGGAVDVGALEVQPQPTNQPPIAQCQNVIVSANSSCMANASIDNGSHDPDAGDTITLNQSPAAPHPLGTTNVTLTVMDSHGATSFCMATVTVVDTTPPAITCPASITVGTDPGRCSATVNPGTAAVTDNCPGSIVAGLRSDGQPLNAAYPKGTTAITWRAMDAAGNMSACPQSATVNDTEKPAVTSSVTQSLLSPPSHDLVNVGLSATATDNCSGAPAIQVLVFGNEDDETPTGDATHSPDAKNIALGTLRLRAERLEGGNGRVYLIVVKATDSSGNVGVSASTVVVPKGQGQAAMDSVNALAATAKAFSLANNGDPPPGYFVVGDGLIIGPKQ